MATLAVLAWTAVGAQSWEFSNAQKLPQTINDSRSEESLPLVSADGNTLYFVRTFHPENVGSKENTQDIWIAERDTSGAWLAAGNNFPALNNKEHNAVVGLSPDGYKVYLHGTYQSGKLWERGLSVSQRQSDGFSAPVAERLPFLNEIKGTTYSLFVCREGKLAFISATGTKGAGGMDLFMVQRTGGAWGTPVSVAGANTASDEISPYFHEPTQTLFFSSNRAGGAGGFDVYSIAATDSTLSSWGAPALLPAPVNSDAFDAYLSLDNRGKGYVSSARGDSLANLWVFDWAHTPAEDTIQVAGEDIAVVAVEEPTDEEVRQRDPELVIETRDGSGNGKTSLSELTREELLDSLTRLRFIYFEFDRSKLRPVYTRLLDQVVKVLNDHPDMRVIFEGHTDSVGSVEYNQGLSERRAQEAMSYVTAMGIEAHRVAMEGYSELRPYADNETAEGRGKNRRVELKFLLIP